jgi:hypothetical protein
VTAVIVPDRDLNKAFSIQVSALRLEWKNLHLAHKQLAEMTINFGKNIQKLTKLARSIDKTVDGAHARYLRQQISAQIGTNNPSILSKWIAIGAQAPALLSVKDSLPATRDGIYEIALAAGEHKPIERWIEQGKLSSESSVRDVQGLRRKIKKRPPTKNSHKLISVTLTINGSYTDAAKALLRVVQDSIVVKVGCEIGIREVIKSELGRDQYKNVADKFPER